MKVGVPREIKNNEYRVGLTPAAVKELIASGHRVLVETQAGAAIGFCDEEYLSAGADILGSADEVFARAELIVKVKEPLAVERARLREHHSLFTFLHLAPDPEQTGDLMASGALCIAYETVTDEAGRLPLLAPMSEVAGRMSVQAGAHCLEKEAGGRGVLLGGVPGVEPGVVTILGAGVVGRNALAMAVGLGADVTILDRNVNALRAIDERYGNRVRTLLATAHALEDCVLRADLVIGAVLVPGATAPKLVSRDMVARMKTGAVLVDVSIDQGGCFETSRPTTHQDPTFEVEGVIHYCVANMPGAVARTSTLALNNVTLPYVLALADKGTTTALLEDPHLRNGLNVARGRLCRKEVAEAQGLEYQSALDVLGAFTAS
ncbi:alanine dehydrogenase [Thiorhodococcus mannitoliphagus]|uniref:Alanine dehydrogenase n=1 Tax=Thiorhodococcus mannitoliphagus TaxID=329406 RepID=A0A6P1DTD4_9GAMM|nr:alanine dehydrogenase [Thiorhodococcus mannitoliphagus]NEX19292.1 alanine dehydrogenase [Thiorhodococcus mannitoliphagus]